MGCSVVATNQVHYHDRSEVVLSDVLAAIRGRRTLVEQDGYRTATADQYLKSPAEMTRRFARYPGVVARAGDLGRRLAFDLGLVAPNLPDFPMPGPFRDELGYLRHLTYDGAREVYPGGGPDGSRPAWWCSRVIRLLVAGGCWE